jgi:hypothetical protein
MSRQTRDCGCGWQHPVPANAVRLPAILSGMLVACILTALRFLGEKDVVLNYRRTNYFKHHRKSELNA